MTKDAFGRWEVKLPDIDGKPAIPHRSRVKIKMQTPAGNWIDRIPAMIKCVGEAQVDMIRLTELRLKKMSSVCLFP